jgi:U3 small nucleolar RNA-associated protein 16
MDVPAGSTPRGSAKRGREKRELEHEGTPTATKRRRKSVSIEKLPQDLIIKTPVRGVRAPGDEETVDNTLDTIAVTIPDRTKERSESPIGEKNTSSTRHGSPKVIIPKRTSPRTSTETSPTKVVHDEASYLVRENLPETPSASQSSLVFVTPATQMEQGGSLTPKNSAKTKKSSPASNRSSSRHKRIAQGVSGLVDTAAPSVSTLPDETIPSTRETNLAPTILPDLASELVPNVNKVHKRFDSEDRAELSESATPNLQGHTMHSAFEEREEQKVAINESPLDDDASDSDEAPEMVTAATAASKARATAEETSRAHLAQQEKENRRKQQREDRIAEEQAEKRKRDQRKAKKLAKFQAKEAQAHRRDSTPPRAPLDVDMTSLPALLPASLLETMGDHRPPTPPLVRTGNTAEQVRKEKLNHHIKFLERGEKPIKDLKKGSVNVSVLARQNKLLAPKVNRDTKNIREHWLKGRQQDKSGKKGMPKGRFRKMERKVVGSHRFLRGSDD